MRSWSWIVALMILLGLTICVPMPVASVEPVPPIVPTSGTFEKYGPRVNDLIFSIWGDVLAESEALAAGDIDVMDCPAPRGYVEDGWWDNPDITLGNYSEWGWYEYDLNNQMWPIGHGEMTPVGWTGDEPAVTTGHYWINYSCQRCLDARQFRRALAHLTDRTTMVTQLGIYADPMETFIFPALADWENPDAPKYAYNLTLAEEALIAGGFQDWDSDNVTEYSPSHGVVPDDYEELPTLQMWLNIYNPDSKLMVELLRDEMMILGIPLEAHLPDRVIWPPGYHPIWGTYEYHVYAGRWTWGRAPDMYYDLFHSEKDIYPSFGADNYVRYHSQEFDTVGKALNNASDEAAAKTACDQAQMILHRDVAVIPLCSPGGYTARRTNYGTHAGEAVYAGHKWDGFCNELGSGFYSSWNPLNVHPHWFMKGGVLRQGMLVDIEKWSPVHAEWFYDWLILDQIYESLIAYHPYNITKFVPILARELPEVLTWTLDGETCTRLRFTPDSLAFWHDLTPVTLDDVGFSFHYMRDEVSVANYWAVANFYDYLTADNASDPDWDPLPGPGEIDILYNVESWLALEWASNVPIIPKHIWEGIDSWTWNPEDHDMVIGTGPFMCYKDGVVGRVDHMLGNYAHLIANPYYHRKYVWPDVTNAAHEVMARDGYVTRADYDVVRWEGHKNTYDPILYPLLPPWPPEWVDPETGENYLDVDKNGAIDLDDLLELSIKYGQEWPPPWYVDC